MHCGLVRVFIGIPFRTALRIHSGLNCGLFLACYGASFCPALRPHSGMHSCLSWVYTGALLGPALRPRSNLHQALCVPALGALSVLQRSLILACIAVFIATALKHCLCCFRASFSPAFGPHSGLHCGHFLTCIAASLWPVLRPFYYVH